MNEKKYRPQVGDLLRGLWEGKERYLALVLEVLPNKYGDGYDYILVYWFPYEGARLKPYTAIEKTAHWDHHGEDTGLGRTRTFFPGLDYIENPRQHKDCSR